jgi:hypothetical protein
MTITRRTPRPKLRIIRGPYAYLKPVTRKLVAGYPRMLFSA